MIKYIECEEKRIAIVNNVGDSLLGSGYSNVNLNLGYGNIVSLLGEPVEVEFDNGFSTISWSGKLMDVATKKNLFFSLYLCNEYCSVSELMQRTDWHVGSFSHMDSLEVKELFSKLVEVV